MTPPAQPPPGDEQPAEPQDQVRLVAHDQIADTIGEEELSGRAGALVAGMWSTAMMVVPLAATLALSVVIGRFLGPDALGEQNWISYVNALFAALLIQTLVRAGIQTLSTARGADDSGEYANLARWIMLFQIAGGTVSALVLAAFSFFSDYQAAWLFASATAAVNAIGWSFSVRIIAEQGWAAVAKRRLVTQLLAQAAAVVLVVAGFGIAGVFAASLVAAVVLLVLLVPISPGLGPARRGRLPRQLVRIWGLYVTTELLSQVVTQRIEFVFLAWLSTKDQLAMYSIPYMVVGTVTLIPESAATSLLPALAARAGAGKQHVVDAHLPPAVRVIALVSVPLAAGVAVLGPRLIVLAYGSQFEQAGSLVSIMALLILLVPVFDLLNIYWGGFGRLGLPLLAVSIGGAVDVALALALIPGWAALGATIANVVGQGLCAVVLIMLTRRRLPTLTMAWGRYAVVVAASALAAAAGWGIQHAVAGLVGWLLALAVMGALLAGFGATVGFTTKADAQWLKGAIPARLLPFLKILSGRRSELSV